MSQTAQSRSPALRRYLPDCLILLLLLGLTLKMSYDGSAVRDLGLDDESSYLTAGFNLLQGGWPDPQWSPLYIY